MLGLAAFARRSGAKTPRCRVPTTVAREAYHLTPNPPCRLLLRLRSFSTQFRDDDQPSASVFDLGTTANKYIQENGAGNHVTDEMFQIVVSRLEELSSYRPPSRRERRHGLSQKKLESIRNILDSYDSCLQYLYELHLRDPSKFRINRVQEWFLSPTVTSIVFRVALWSETPLLETSERVRNWERKLGTIGKTESTDELTFHLLEAHSKSGNVGRALSLLEFREKQGDKSINTKGTKKGREDILGENEVRSVGEDGIDESSHIKHLDYSEFKLAIDAIQVAGSQLKKNRNIFLSESMQPALDNPTRWLDAILLNMSRRNVPLTQEIASQMLDTFASTGWTGYAIHHFYCVYHSPIHESESVTRARKYPVAMKDGKPVKIFLRMKPPPPFYKVPSRAKGKNMNKKKMSGGSKHSFLTRFDVESDPTFSETATAAFSFANSLEHGACGHDPLELSSECYSALVKVCVHRGALWRAMHIIDTIMPSKGMKSSISTYNILLMGLAFVGDPETIRLYVDRMLMEGIEPNTMTIDAIVLALVNRGDVATAITVVQDYFNQYSEVPSISTHLKILEIALGMGLPYEAKRYLYVLEQLRRPNEHHSEEIRFKMAKLNNEPKLSKKAIERMFAYFDETLSEQDLLQLNLNA